MSYRVACPACRRHYTARPDKLGVQFHCRCGHVLTVTAPPAQDAAVVRCSSCGAARSGSASHCAHCGADFTLHERDLQSVCPECLTRVSERAQYCHHCGGLLSEEEEIGAATDLRCPSCREEAPLHTRQIGSERHSALECGACAGLWVGTEVFTHLARGAKKESLPPLLSGQEKEEFAQPEPPPQRSGYLPCPECNSFMHRRNYGYKSGKGGSGIIVEICRDHGIWFDCQELAAVLQWIRTGGAVDPRSTPEALEARSGFAARSNRHLRRSHEPDFFDATDVLTLPVGSPGLGVDDVVSFLFGR